MLKCIFFLRQIQFNKFVHIENVGNRKKFAKKTMKMFAGRRWKLSGSLRNQENI